MSARVFYQLGVAPAIHRREIDHEGFHPRLRDCVAWVAGFCRPRSLWALPLVAIVCGACGGRPPSPESPTAVSPSPAPPPPSVGNDLAGVYTLTIEADPTCVSLPPAIRKRSYTATLSTTPYSFLGVSIEGGGFDHQVVSGTLYETSRLEWNNFDIGGCDGQKEPLGSSSTLTICGTGFANIDGPTISVLVVGKIWVEDNGQPTSYCAGKHQFRFQRQVLGPAPQARR